MLPWFAGLREGSGALRRACSLSDLANPSLAPRRILPSPPSAAAHAQPHHGTCSEQKQMQTQTENENGNGIGPTKSRGGRVGHVNRRNAARGGKSSRLVSLVEGKLKLSCG